LRWLGPGRINALENDYYRVQEGEVRLMMRRTLQRDAIRQVLVRADRPLSTGEIFGAVKAKVPGLGMATVYRALKALLGEGLLREVGLPGKSSRWELAGKAHHHHFLCDTCDRLLEINACPEDIGRLLPKGYTLGRHDILLQGQCAECTSRGKSGH
jgi:Fur family transcriptional regulator, ferric uptake regulator